MNAILDEIKTEIICDIIFLYYFLILSLNEF